MLSCFVNMSYYKHLMLLRDERGIILEQQLWWAGLHLGTLDRPLYRAGTEVQLINSQGWGGQVSTGVTLRGPQRRGRDATAGS